MNEHQLAIAESTTSQREELKVDMAVCKQIMTVEQAQAFALQRRPDPRHRQDRADRDDRVAGRQKDGLGILDGGEHARRGGCGLGPDLLEA